MSALTERHAERVRALLAGPGDDITVRRASRALGCSDSQARAAIVLLAEQGALRQVNSASGVDMWEQVEPPTAEDYAEAGLPGLAPMPERPSPLVERLAQAIRVADGQHTLGAAVLSEHLAHEVAEWLREQAEMLSAESSPSLDNDLRHDIHVAAGEITGLADRVERGEA